jgi:predicted short-subunit dehydrogenase-like oxidoreductase (DUF2520 family)
VQSVRFIGPGRAGRSLARALGGAGWRVKGLLDRGDDPTAAAEGVDMLVISTPDHQIAGVASAVRPRWETLVIHLSGSLGVDVLAPHPRRAALHPLVPLPDAAIGAARLSGGATFALSGDPAVRQVAECLGGRVVEVPDVDRAAYHAAASIAANHVVALLGHVERVAASVGLGLESFLGLTRAAVDDVERLGPRRALTGPAARGDWETLTRHRQALAPEERAGYDAGVALALRLAAPAQSTMAQSTTAAAVDPDLTGEARSSVPGVRRLADADRAARGSTPTLTTSGRA